MGSRYLTAEFAAAAKRCDPQARIPVPGWIDSARPEAPIAEVLHDMLGGVGMESEVDELVRVLLLAAQGDDSAHLFAHDLLCKLQARYVHDHESDLMREAA